MFKNYDNLSKEYIPNNSFTEEDYIYKAVNTNLPYELYNIKGEHIGYGWGKESNFDFEIPLPIEFQVPCDSILFQDSGTSPKINTFSKKGQKAYNIKDMISWTCIKFGSNGILWEKDKCLEVCEDNGYYVNFTPDALHIKVIISNFRYDRVYENTFDVNAGKLIINSKELDLEKGVYNVEIYGLSQYKGLIKSFLISVGEYPLDKAVQPIKESCCDETIEKEIVYDGTTDPTTTSQQVQVIYDGGLLTL